VLKTDQFLAGGGERDLDHLVELGDDLELGTPFAVVPPQDRAMAVEPAQGTARLVQPRTVIPIHYEGWKHFREGREAIERELATAPEDIRQRIRWLPIGVATELAA